MVVALTRGGNLIQLIDDIQIQLIRGPFILGQVVEILIKLTQDTREFLGSQLDNFEETF